VKRADAEQLALSYAKRHVEIVRRERDCTRPQAERHAVAEATARYGLTDAAQRRIRVVLRQAR
jgi:hypothetical protein